MTLKNIIEELDLFLPNPYKNEEKVMFLNKTIIEIRRFGGKADIFTFGGNGGRIYPLPTGIGGENVLCVSVNGCEYFPKRIKEEGDGFYTFMPQGFITVEPPLKTDDEISIYYCTMNPFKLRGEFESEDDFLNQETDIDPEYKYLLLYGAMADISAALEDTDMSNNLRSEYNEMKTEALSGRYKRMGKYPVTKNVRGALWK